MPDDVTKSAFARVCAAIEERLAEQDIDVALGQTELGRQGGARRVVFVLAGGRLSAPMAQAGIQRGKTPSDPSYEVKPLYTAKLSVIAKISAEDEEALDRVWVDVLTAARLVLGPGSQPGAFVMDSQAQGVGVSGRSSHEQLTQQFEWTLTLTARRPHMLGSITSGTETARVERATIDYHISPGGAP